MNTPQEIGVRISFDVRRMDHLLDALHALVAATRPLGNPALVARLETTTQEVSAVESI